MPTTFDMSILLEMSYFILKAGKETSELVYKFIRSWGWARISDFLISRTNYRFFLGSWSKCYPFANFSLNCCISELIL
jgi:hypothetical protein